MMKYELISLQAWHIGGFLVPVDHYRIHGGHSDHHNSATAQRHARTRAFHHQDRSRLRDAFSLQV